MEKIPKYLAILLILMLSGCEESGKLEDYLRPAPSQPLADVIRTSLPVGHCALAAMADQAGYPIPYEVLPLDGGLTLIRIHPDGSFPLVYLDECCREILVLCFPVDEDLAILSIFFVNPDPASLLEKILEIHTIPVMLEEGKVRAVFASQDIYVRDSIELSLHMGPADIQLELGRLEVEEPETSEAAIEQNAWSIHADPAGTWDDFRDDVYALTGGQQDISVLSGQSRSETCILQLAMIETIMSPECLLAPLDGFALLREIGVDTGPRNNLEDLVLGTVLYRFRSTCTGQVDIVLATGNFFTSTGKKVDLGL